MPPLLAQLMVLMFGTGNRRWIGRCGRTELSISEAFATSLCCDRRILSEKAWSRLERVLAIPVLVVVPDAALSALVAYIRSVRSVCSGLHSLALIGCRSPSLAWPIMDWYEIDPESLSTRRLIPSPKSLTIKCFSAALQVSLVLLRQEFSTALDRRTVLLR